eukprot:UN33151
MDLGDFSQMDLKNKRPPACTLYSALAVEYIIKNYLTIKKEFLDDNVKYFQIMQKSIYDEGIPIYFHAREHQLTSLLDGRINPDELAGKLPERFK